MSVGLYQETKELRKAANRIAWVQALALQFRMDRDSITSDDLARLRYIKDDARDGASGG